MNSVEKKLDQYETVKKSVEELQNSAKEFYKMNEIQINEVKN